MSSGTDRHRFGDEVYPAAISDAGGIVETGKAAPAFFVVVGTAMGGRNDLAVTNKFDIVIRQVIGEPDRKISARPEPPEVLSSAQQSTEEPVLPSAEESQTSSRLGVTGAQNPAKPHGRRKKSRATEASYAAQPKEQERKEKTASDVDE